MIHFIVAVLSLAAGLFDRLRGYGTKAKLLWKVLLGFVLAVPYGFVFDPIAIVFALGIAVGLSPAWGTPVFALMQGELNPKEYEQERFGYDSHEWWQRGILKTNGFLAVMFRGLMVGIPVIPFYFIVGASIFYVSLVSAFVYVLSPFVSILLHDKFKLNKHIEDKTAVMEFVRGALQFCILFYIVK